MNDLVPGGIRVLVLYTGSLLLLLLIICLLVRLILRFILTVSESRYYLEVTPPAQSAMSSQATGELMQLLHGVGLTRTPLEMLLGIFPRLSFEIIGSKAEGIRYIISSPARLTPLIEQQFHSYLSGAVIRRIATPDFVSAGRRAHLSQEFQLSRHYALPLRTQKDLTHHDPLSYLTGAMTNLEADEQIYYQIILSPRRIPEATYLSRRILMNEDVLERLMGRKSTAIQSIFKVINNGLFHLTDSIGGLNTPAVRLPPTTGADVNAVTSHRQQVQARLKPSRVISSFEQEVVTGIQEKLSEPLFLTSIRTLVISPRRDRALDRQRQLRTALTSFSTSQYQTLRTKSSVIGYCLAPYLRWLQRRRLFGLRRDHFLLSAHELADLFHFPYAGSTTTENIVSSLSRPLPAPISLKNNPALDVLLGENIYHGVRTPIGLTSKERQRHMYVIGGTGNGKTTLLQYALVQDIRAGKGVAVIDPHGDLAESLLSYIPPERIKDVIYLNPDDLAHPIGVNLLELPPGLSGDELIREKDLLTESTISVFRKLFSDDDSGGHRVEYILRNTIQTALTLESPTLFTLYDLLNDSRYRNKVTRTLEDENLKNFWKFEMGKAGDFQRVKMAAGITAKVGRFLFSGSARRMLEKPKSTIDFDDILGSGKILICNFSKGLLGEDTSALFGTMILAKLQLAALRRARLAPSTRRPFYLYVDEFQNFATMSFVQMLSEARKYQLFLTMAEQSTTQQEEQRLVQIILANVGTVVCFRSGSPADEALLLPLFLPYLQAGDIANLPSYHYYIRLSGVTTQEPFSGTTVLLDEPAQLYIARRVIASSRQRYALPVGKIQPEASQRTVATPTKTQVTVRRKTAVEAEKTLTALKDAV